jgi:hypothetical protein
MAIVGAMWVAQGTLIAFAASSGATAGGGMPACLQISPATILLTGIVMAAGGALAWLGSERALTLFGGLCWARLLLAAVDAAAAIRSGYYIDTLVIASPIFEAMLCSVSLLIAREQVQAS